MKIVPDDIISRSMYIHSYKSKLLPHFCYSFHQYNNRDSLFDNK